MEQTDAKNLMRMMDINKKVEDAVNSPAATAAIDAKFKEISSGDMFAMYMTISGVRPDDIKQGLVRLAQLLELALLFRLIGMLVRVTHPGPLVVGLLDFGGGRVGSETEEIVVGGVHA